MIVISVLVPHLTNCVSSVLRASMLGSVVSCAVDFLVDPSCLVELLADPPCVSLVDLLADLMCVLLVDLIDLSGPQNNMVSPLPKCSMHLWTAN